MFRASPLTVVFLSVSLLLVGAGARADWPQFRGPGGLGISTEKNLPTTWSESSNLLWRTELPGPGSSSPIVVGDKIFITCYSGYGLNQNDPGDMANLKRHLLCLDRAGRILWTRDVPAPKEYPFRSFQILHGYASSTPVSDGKNVYCFFGASGVVAFDLAGKQLWRQSVGTKTHDWGSGSSPILAGNLVIVNAGVESEALIALNKATGKQVWAQKGMSWSWNTPLLTTAKGRKELVVSVHNQLRAFDPQTGKELWNCDGIDDYVCPSVVGADGVVYAIGARQGAAMAVRGGGTGDVSKTHVLWNISKGSNVSSPVIHDGHLYWAHEGNGTVYCVETQSGKVLYEKRLEPRADRLYASALAADGKIYYVSRNAGAYVLEAAPKFKQLAHNTIQSDPSVFNGSIAVMDGKLLLRSDQALYCIGSK